MSRSQRSSDERQNQPDAAVRLRPAFRRRLQLGGRRIQAWRPTGLRRWGLIRFLLTSYVAAGVTLYVQPGRSASALALLGPVIAIAVVGTLLRPVLAGAAVVVDSFGLLLIGIVSQAIILDVPIAIDPNVDIGGHPAVLFVSWPAAVVAGAVTWLFDTGTEDTFLAQLLGRAIRVARARARSADSSRETKHDGLIVIQFDGVGEDVLRQAMAAGALPTVSGWLHSQSHTVRGWHTGLPATTPAGQAVLLHGNVTEVPSFRWFEKESGRLMVANHPRDAAEIERRISNGHGLLADRGVSVSNLFSGDAPTQFLTMSDARLPPRSTQRFAAFATTPTGLARSLVVLTKQMVIELYQGQRQRQRHMRPRVRRGAVFALERAVSTALLGDPTVAIVTEQIALGARVIYVDFVNYDELAHHAGPSREESMQTLGGFDGLVQFFLDVIRETGRDYQIAIVSDHGQSQGATFAQLAGLTLQEVVAQLTVDVVTRPDAAQAVKISADPMPAERWGSANLLLTGVARSEGAAARAVTRAHAGAAPDAEITVGPPRANAPVTPVHEAAVVIAASGSLAHVYLRAVPGRASREEIDALYPRLIEGLAQHPFIGAVMVRSAPAGTLVVLGTDGWRMLTADGAVGGHGEDPLAVFGPQAAADLHALDGRLHVGDLVLLGRYDPTSEEVAAFEDLVGSHGGLGGGQTGAVLVHPSSWSAPSGRDLRGTDVYELLRGQLHGDTGTDIR